MGDSKGGPEGFWTAPFIPLFWEDWVAGTGRLSLAEEGAYLRLCMEQWAHGPFTLEEASRIMPNGTDFGAIWRALRPKFQELPEGGRWQNPKLERVRVYAKSGHLKRIRAAKKGVFGEELPEEMPKNCRRMWRRSAGGSAGGNGEDLPQHRTQNIDPRTKSPEAYSPDHRRPMGAGRRARGGAHGRAREETAPGQSFGAVAPPAALPAAGSGQKPRAQARLTPEQEAARKAMGDAWIDAYRTVHGQDYVSATADWTSLAQLVRRTQDADEFRQRAFNLLQSPVPFHRQHQTLRYLVSEYPSFTEAHQAPFQCRSDAEDARLRRLLSPAKGPQNGHQTGHDPRSVGAPQGQLWQSL